MDNILESIGIIFGCVVGRMLYDAIIKRRNTSRFTFKIERGRKNER